MKPLLEIGFWNVGQGDATTLFWNDGSISFIDLGPKNTSSIPTWLDQPVHQKRRIREIILTHCHDDHMGDLQGILQKHHQRIDRVWLINDRNEPNKYLQTTLSYLDRLQKKSLIDYKFIQPGPNCAERVAFWTPEASGIELYSVHPFHRSQMGLAKRKNPDPNDMSAVVILDIQGETQIIWGGDAPQRIVSETCQNKEPFLLMGPHHGGPHDRNKSEYDKAFNYPNPNHVWVSAGTGNKHEHPLRKKFLKPHMKRERNILCSCLVHCCPARIRRLEQNNDNSPVVQWDLANGLLPPSSGKLISCRGAMRLTWNEAGFEFDGGHEEHRQKIRNGDVQKPLCVAKK